MNLINHRILLNANKPNKLHHLVYFLAGCLAIFCHQISHSAETGCRIVKSANNEFAVCSYDPRTQQIRMFLNNAYGKVLGDFSAVSQHLEQHGEHLVFAMNGGMYHGDRSPVGLYVEKGIRKHAIVLGSSFGNFGMQPNGVFCVTQQGAQVLESRRFVKSAPRCLYATQSGPMLVINGHLHPRFLKESTSRHIRNGVGVDRSGQVHFVISSLPITFYDFAQFFLQQLHTPNALYLDGSISRLYAPELGRHDRGRQLGPIIGVVASKSAN